MSKEGIKSIILTVLVLLSLFLTWNLWTYSPNLDPINPQYMDDIEISNKEEIASIVQPVQILYHTDEQHYGTSSDNVLDDAMEIFNDWTFSDFEDVSSDFSSQELLNFTAKPGTSEIIFADSVPLVLYKQVINIEDRDLPEVEFNRIIIKSTGETGSVYFTDTEVTAVYKLDASTSDVKSFNEYMKNIYNTFDTYLLTEITENFSLYLPESEMNVKSYKYYFELLDVEEFRDALFEDPKLVKQVPTMRGVRYTDVLSRMNVYNDTMMLSYIDPTQAENVTVSSSQLLEKSIQFVNDHAGWVENFRYAELNSEKQKVIFRLYMQGLPVFNSNGMSQIVQVWAQDQIYSYDRPFFTMNFPVPSGTHEVTLMSGKEAVALLQQQEDFQPYLLEGMAIGYQLTRDEDESRLISLVPQWHYKYNGEWKPLKSTVAGGTDDGLE